MSRALPRVMTPKMVAQEWGCTEHHVRKLIRNGELPSWRAGGTLIRVFGSDVEEYECRQRGKSLTSAKSADTPSHGETPAESGTVTRLAPLTRARLNSVRRPSIQS